MFDFFNIAQFLSHCSKSNPNSEDGTNVDLLFQAYNLGTAITKDEVVVMIGNQRCPVQPIETDIIQCTVPKMHGKNFEDFVRQSVDRGKPALCFIINTILGIIEEQRAF